MLYTIMLDDNKFLDPLIDSDQLDRLVGTLSTETRTRRIDLYHGPRSFAGVFSEPLKVNFPIFKKSKVKSKT